MRLRRPLDKAWAGVSFPWAKSQAEILARISRTSQSRWPQFYRAINYPLDSGQLSVDNGRKEKT